VDHLKAIKNYFLLCKGELYQTFLEEARSIKAMPPQSTSEYDLNSGPLRQTMMKLGLEDDLYLKLFKIKLRSFQFNFNNFSTMQGLYSIGDERNEKRRNYAFMIRSSKNSSKSGTFWPCLKQRLDMGFKTSFSFKLKIAWSILKG
jgi:gamma-tubulin complex component 4